MVVRQDTTDIFVGFGERLRSERIKLMKTQSEFSALAATSSQTQMRYETGQSFPKLEYLFELSKHGVDIGYIVTGRRNDGSMGSLDQSLLDQFNALKDDQKAALMHLIGVMGDKPLLHADNIAPRQSQTLHSPAAPFRGKHNDH